MEYSPPAHQFGQKAPRFTCRHAGKFKDMSERMGYSVKCRNWRCSLECHANAARKWGLCVEHHLLKCLSDGMTVYRGCLKLPKGATPEDHKRAKDSFLLAIRRWAKRHGHHVEMCAKIDLSSLTEAHWDTVLWTDAPHRKLHDFFGQSWKRAGGDHQSLVKVLNEELTATIRYTAKDMNLRPGEHIIPASSDVMPLECTWTTAGFWRGSSMDSVWSELIQEWLKAKNGQCGLQYIISQHTDTLDPEIAAQLNVFIDQRYIPGQDKHYDRQAFLTRLPRTPEQGVGLAEYAERWGVRVEYMQSILESTPLARRNDGHVDKAGHCHFNGWYLATPA